MQLTLVAIALFASVAFATPIADNEKKSVIARSEQPARRDAIASPEDHGYDYKHKYYDEHHDEYKPGNYDGYHESKPENYKHYDGNSYHDKRRVDRHHKIHKVVVGGPNILAYDPPQLVAKKGDKIVFIFMEKNHTLTSSEFQTPCTPNGDFDTGFVPNPDNKAGFTREFYVRDKMPHWFFCRQATHCSKGMVFALNPTPKNTFEKFQQLALATASEDGGVAIPPFNGQKNKPLKSDYMQKDDYKPENNDYNNDYNNY